jgi:hypothetical protein
MNGKAWREEQLVPEKKTTFRMPPDMGRRLKVKCASMGVTQTDVILRAIDEFLSEKPGLASVAPTASAGNKRWHDWLELILQSDVRTAADTVQHVIRCAHELVLAKGSANDSKRGAGRSAL